MPCRLWRSKPTPFSSPKGDGILRRRLPHEGEKNAKNSDDITYMDVLSSGLKGMDATAHQFVVQRDNICICPSRLQLKNPKQMGNIRRVVRPEEISIAE